MHISMKANYKAVGSSCAGCRHCRHAARHGLQAPGSITPLSAALQHTHTACLQHSTAALQTRQNVNCCSMQQYDKILITVPKEIKMLVQKGKKSVALLFTLFEFRYTIKTFTKRTKKRLGPHKGSDKKLELTNVQHFLRMSQQKN